MRGAQDSRASLESTDEMRGRQGIMNRQVKAKLRKNRIIAIFVGAAVLFFCIIMISQILNSRKLNEEKEARKARLDEQIELENQRSVELNAEEAYINTTDYIEEKAKSVGYVYPDEIVFKRED